MKHLVNTLQLDITCGSEDDAFSLQHHLAPLLQQQVAEAVEKAARNITDPADLVIIDRIEIDLGAISFHANEQALATAIEYEIARQLQPYLQPKPVAEKNTAQQQNTTALFRYFMLTGNLPWWAQSVQPDISSVFIELMETCYNETVDFLYENRDSPVFWQRVVYQLNREAKKKMAAAVQNIKEAVALLKEAAIRVQQAKSGKDDKVSEVKQEREIIAEEKLLDILLLDAPLLYGAVSANNLLQALALIIERNIQLPVMEMVLSEAKKWKSKPAATTNSKQADDTVLPIATENKAIEYTLPEPVVENAAGQEVEKYFIQHSGIILLSPYLNTLFYRLQLLEEGQWKNSSACFKGVHLLKYLVCGARGIAEYELTFEKIICGLSPAIPVPADAGLEPHELQEADSLLQSVIENWKKLGNTSVNGLRESFLKRGGILTSKENNWLLQVERKTMDVLLDSIPWGFSTVSLPWNNYIIFTEW